MRFFLYSNHKETLGAWFNSEWHFSFRNQSRIECDMAFLIQSLTSNSAFLSNRKLFTFDVPFNQNKVMGRSNYHIAIFLKKIMVWKIGEPIFITSQKCRIGTIPLLPDWHIWGWNILLKKYCPIYFFHHFPVDFNSRVMDFRATRIMGCNSFVLNMRCILTFSISLYSN